MRSAPLEEAVSLSPAFVTDDAPFRRRLASGGRPPEGEERYDGKTMVHDVFRSEDGGEIILIGPPPANLESWYFGILKRALPAGTEIRPFIDFRHCKVRIRSAADSLRFDDRFLSAERLAVQPNLSARFAGRRVLTTLSKDNPLEWIVDWVHFHAAVHGCDALLLYDNGSTLYALDELERTLAAVPGIEAITVLSWPYAYGMQGGSNFCQFCMLEHARRRFLVHARSVVNADVDELPISRDGRSLFELAEQSATGYVRVPGRYVSNATRARPEGRRHRDFTCRDPGDAPSTFKWAAVPGRCPDEAAWRVHHIFGMASDDALAAHAEFQHFKAINTNWLVPRWQPGVPLDAGAEPDAELAEWLARVPWRESPQRPPA